MPGRPRGKKNIVAGKTSVITAKLAKEVRTLVHKPLKYVASQNGIALLSDTVNTNAFTNLYSMLPTVVQGTDEFNRIGDRVIPHSLRSHFTLFLDSGNNFTADIYVRLICVNVKAVKSSGAVAGFPGRDLLNQGDGQSIDPPAGSGSTLNTLVQYSKYPINTKAYSVFYDKVHRISKNQGQLTGDGSSTTSPVVTQATCHTVTVHHKTHPAQLKYDSATGSLPNNFYPVWCAYAWSSTGAPFSGGFVNCALRNDMTYTDA